jgi:hypothetical protein
MGGYREGSGRSKHGYYKGVYCGSSYELCWVIYNLDHNIPFNRFEGYLSNEEIKYYPDFLIDNKIVEIKGYWTEEVDKKTQLALEKGYEISVLYKEDLQYAFEYVSKQYGITSKTSFHTLFDDHKPKYVLTCDNCGIEYFSERKPKSKTNFCSRKCCGIYARRKNATLPSFLNSRTQTQYQRKLNEEQIKDIFFSQDTYRKIAEKHKVHKSLVSAIKHKTIHKKLLDNL